MTASNLPLKIAELSDIFIPPEGGKKLFILCDGIQAEDVAVRFSCKCGNQWWEVTVPPYSGGALDYAREVFVRIFRPSDKKSSSSQLMYFVPKC